jgi:hypothetical protein
MIDNKSFMQSRKPLAAPSPLRSALPPLTSRKANPFTAPQEEDWSEDAVAEELNHIFTLPYLRRHPSPNMFGNPLKKPPSPSVQPPTRPSTNPILQDASFLLLDNMSDTSTCDTSLEILRSCFS